MYLLPPKALVSICATPALKPMAVTGDILDDRDGWQTAFKGCAAKMQGVVNWRTAHVKGN